MEKVRKKGISGSTLKLIAIVTMLIDHIGAVVLARILLVNGFTEELYNIYYALRMIGRVAFPIFCFLLVEGFTKTSNVKRYALRLALFALISEVPFDLALKAEVLEFQYQNVFFTLLLGFLTIWVLSQVEKQEWKWYKRLAVEAVVIVAGVLLAELLKTDYGGYGVIAIAVLYVLRYRKGLQLFGGCIAFLWEEAAMLAFIPVAFYNGERGWKLKYVFYLFYPLHLLLLYLICVVMGTATQPVV